MKDVLIVPHSEIQMKLLLDSVNIFAFVGHINFFKSFLQSKKARIRKSAQLSLYYLLVLGEYTSTFKNAIMGSDQWVGPTDITARLDTFTGK